MSHTNCHFTLFWFKCAHKGASFMYTIIISTDVNTAHDTNCRIISSLSHLIIHVSNSRVKRELCKRRGQCSIQSLYRGIKPSQKRMTCKVENVQQQQNIKRAKVWKCQTRRDGTQDRQCKLQKHADVALLKAEGSQFSTYTQHTSSASEWLHQQTQIQHSVNQRETERERVFFLHGNLWNLQAAMYRSNFHIFCNY